jgi:cytochrome c553
MLLRAALVICILKSFSVISTKNGFAEQSDNNIEPHWNLLSQEAYPRAAQCGVCHQQIYREWSASNHAYSSISPMFHKFEQKINELSSGTVGAFCVRCHQQIGTQLGESGSRRCGSAAASPVKA